MQQTEKATHKWNEWTLGDIIFGIVIPTIVALLIVGISLLSTRP